MLSKKNYIIHFFIALITSPAIIKSNDTDQEENETKPRVIVDEFKNLSPVVHDRCVKYTLELANEENDINKTGVDSCHQLTTWVALYRQYKKKPDTERIMPDHDTIDDITNMHAINTRRTIEYIKHLRTGKKLLYTIVSGQTQHITSRRYADIATIHAWYTLGEVNADQEYVENNKTLTQLIKLSLERYNKENARKNDQAS